MEFLILPKRYVLAVMIFSGFFIMYALRVNINVAIGAMVNNHTLYVNGRTVFKVTLFNIYTLSCILCCNKFSKYSWLDLSKQEKQRLWILA